MCSNDGKGGEGQPVENNRCLRGEIKLSVEYCETIIVWKHLNPKYMNYMNHLKGRGAGLVKN